MKVIYPMVGGTLANCSKDLISTNNDAFNVDWYNTSDIVVSNLGIKTTADTNYGYGDTKFIPNIQNASDYTNVGYTFVIGQLGTGWSQVLGAWGSNNRNTLVNTLPHLYLGRLIYQYRPYSTDPLGVYTQVRNQNATASIIINGTHYYSPNTALGDTNDTDRSLYLFGANTGSGNTTDTTYKGCKHRLQTVMIHKGLTMKEIQDLKDILNTFEQSLGRKTW